MLYVGSGAGPAELAGQLNIDGNDIERQPRDGSLHRSVDLLISI